MRRGFDSRLKQFQEICDHFFCQPFNAYLCRISRYEACSLARENTPQERRPSLVTLFCYVVGSKNTPFPVDISSSLTINHLKEKVQQERPNLLKEIDAAVLELFLISLPDEGNLATKVEGAIEGNRSLSSTTEIIEIFPNDPPQKDYSYRVHGSDLARSVKRPATRDILGRWRNKRPRLMIPSTVSELQTLINTRLLENEKIPLDQGRFDELLGTAPNELRDFLTLEEANSLFRVSDTEHTALLDTIFFHAAFFPPPPLNGTENSFHSFWDANIRNVIQVLVPSGTAIRNSSQHTATRKLRPDFGYLVVPLEVKKQVQGIPKIPELSFCGNSTGIMVQYHIFWDFASVDLSTREGRITHMRWLINLSPLLQDLADLMPQGEAEFQPMIRDHCTVELTARHVVKTYTRRDAAERIEHLKGIYHQLIEKGVPNTDSLYYSSGKTIVLQPRSHLAKPKTEKELLEAVSCVLQVLKAIHPALIFHRDIRWPNVIRRKDDSSQWFLIDWEDAQEAPTKALKHFASDSHSARVFQDGHGGEVDIWGVGHLIMESGVIGLSHEVRELGLWMKEKSPSAEEAWTKLERYKRSCLLGTSQL
ncbi:hypothetical protein K435DRAFT_863292 [Dendrothele bispora CBS 962.96]|uniref:Crinkler effector protein N-terminal domain-containing protein n=1 Tax=Dendrothele bispora (strain CBS 962.96) TaxID=1314807 RepID=A0A4S8LRF6_DENBC|nr:hypothetical protein K435DRAFT_863292 [Dendrothele bispora CBS 962.96]